MPTPEDLALERDEAGRSRPTLDFESRTDGSGAVTRVPRTAEPAPRRSWTPAVGERLPRDTLHLVRTDHLFPEAATLLREIGVPPLDPDRVRLLNPYAEPAALSAELAALCGPVPAPATGETVVHFPTSQLPPIQAKA